MKIPSNELHHEVTTQSHRTSGSIATFNLALLLIVFAFGQPVALADLFDHWHWRNPAPFANTINGLCFGSGKFVAVGNDGVIHTSSDGLTWDDGQRPVASTLNGVVHANGQFLAVGNSGVILTSEDGYQWIIRSSGTTNDLAQAAFGNGRFVACGRGGQLVNSTNGVFWEATTDGIDDLNSITFGNSIFILSTAKNYTYRVRISTDGKTWVWSQYFSATSPLYGVQFGNGTFVAYAETPIIGGSINRFYRSTDGTNWVEGAVGNPLTQHTTPPSTFLTFANGMFYAVASTGISRTTDGINALSSASPTVAPDLFRCLAFGAGRYILTAGLGQTWSSSSGTNWSAEHAGFRTPVSQLIRGSNYVAVAGSLPLMISSDGMNFVPANSPTGIFSAVAYDGTNYAAVGVSGNVISGFTGEVYTSSNSVHWVRRTSNANKSLVGICRGASRWVAVGAAGMVITSPNSLAWTLRASGTANNLNGVAFGNGIYVAVGNVGTVISSPDGTTWDVQLSETTEQLNAVQFLNGQFYALGANGTIITSLDGSVWTSLNSGSTQPLKSIAYGNGCYLACGSYYFNQLYQAVLTSTNGVDWQDIHLKVPLGGTLRSVAYLDGSFWITGDAGAMLQSDSVNGIPHLAGHMLSGGSGFQVRITLNAPAAYCVQYRTNLASGTWQDLAVITNSVSPFTWIDTEANNSPARIYRTAPWP